MTGTAASAATAADQDVVVRVSGVDKVFQREGGAPTTALQGIDLDDPSR